MRAAHVIAFDVGAGSGRVSVGSFHGHRMVVKEVHRFYNRPVRIQGNLYWDILRVFQELKSSLTRLDKSATYLSVGIDGWGADYGLIDARGRLLGNVYHYRDRRTDHIDERLLQKIPARELFDLTASDLHRHYTLCQVYSQMLSGDPLLQTADKLLLIPDLLALGGLASRSAFVSAGTAIVVGAETQVPLLSDACFEHGFKNCPGPEGRNLLMRNNTGFWILQQCRRLWERQSTTSFPSLSELARKAKRSLTVFDPDSSDFASPENMQESIGSFARRTNQTPPVTGGTTHARGKQVTVESPTVARELGIETIYQDLSLANNLTTANNFFLGRELTKSYLGGLVQLLDEKAMNARTEELLHQMNASIPTRKQVAFLSGGQRQAIAIMRVMLWKARLIIMDEPTAALGVAERRKVLDLVKELKQHGVSVLLISHNLPDVLEVTDRIYVIRRGHIVGEVETATASEHTLIQMMIGSEPAALRSK